MDFASIEISALKDILKKNAKNPSDCTTKQSCNYYKRHPKLCRKYVLHTSCVYGDKCDYLHKEKVKSPEEIKLEQRLEVLEKLIEDKSQGEKKMELAVKELEKVVKAMSRKVIQLEEELVIVKDSQKKSFEN